MVKEPKNFIKLLINSSSFTKRPDLIDLAEIDLYNFIVKDFIDLSFTKNEDPFETLYDMYYLLAENSIFDN
ncbi:MAG: hypothetical protein GY830_09005 [Bacteroidetes bacterium]|nr:hypothetical protein [Bacteroidota bacterium]